jgi:hypothetical protein
MFDFVKLDSKKTLKYFYVAHYNAGDASNLTRLSYGLVGKIYSDFKQDMVKKLSRESFLPVEIVSYIKKLKNYVGDLDDLLFSTENLDTDYEAEVIDPNILNVRDLLPEDRIEIVKHFYMSHYRRVETSFLTGIENNMVNSLYCIFKREGIQKAAREHLIPAEVLDFINLIKN